jgi:hypothetical protein
MSKELEKAGFAAHAHYCPRRYGRVLRRGGGAL